MIEAIWVSQIISATSAPRVFWNILDICINFILWRDVWVVLAEAVNFWGNFSSGILSLGSPAGPPAGSVAGLARYLARVFKLHDFVLLGSYYWRQPGRQAGEQQFLRHLLSSGLELCPLALLQLLSYRAQLWVLDTPYGSNTNCEQAMDSSFAHYQGKLTTRPFSYSVNWCTGFWDFQYSWGSDHSFIWIFIFIFGSHLISNLPAVAVFLLSLIFVICYSQLNSTGFLNIAMTLVNIGP